MSLTQAVSRTTNNNNINLQLLDHILLQFHNYDCDALEVSSNQYKRLIVRSGRAQTNSKLTERFLTKEFGRGPFRLSFPLVHRNSSSTACSQEPNLLLEFAQERIYSVKNVLDGIIEFLHSDITLRELQDLLANANNYKVASRRMIYLLILSYIHGTFIPSRFVFLSKEYHLPWLSEGFTEHVHRSPYDFIVENQHFDHYCILKHIKHLSPSDTTPIFLVKMQYKLPPNILNNLRLVDYSIFVCTQACCYRQLCNNNKTLLQDQHHEK